VSQLRIADTGLFVAMGQPSNSRYQAVRRFARRNSITFVLSERVYEELTVDNPDVETRPVDAAIDEGGATVAAPLEFSDPVVSRTMDGVQRYIANVDDRPADGWNVPTPPSLPSVPSTSVRGRRPKCTCTQRISRPARGPKRCSRARGTVTR